jgi:hypothetical protein
MSCQQIALPTKPSSSSAVAAGHESVRHETDVPFPQQLGHHIEHAMRFGWSVIASQARRAKSGLKSE